MPSGGRDCELGITHEITHAITHAIPHAITHAITLTSLTDGLDVLESRCELARVGDRRARELHREIDELAGRRRRGEAIQKRKERVTKMVRRFAREFGGEDIYTEHQDTLTVQRLLCL